MRPNRVWTRALRRIACAFVVALGLASAGTADAYTVTPGWSVSDYVTGFDFQPDHAGPVGLAFDRSANLFIANAWTGSLYKAAPGGGTAASTLLRDHIVGSPSGLAFDKSGKLYMALPLERSVVEVNPASGATVRTVARRLPCPLGLAVDPISGDLFASNTSCGGEITRISGFANGPGTTSQYATVSEPDGLTFAPDGTLYAAGANRILQIAGTNSATPGAVSTLATVPGADGIALLPATPTRPAQLLVVRTDGEVDTVGTDGSLTPIITGASRGDFATVGPDQCVYADLQDRVIKIGPATGMCSFTPPVGGGSGGSGGSGGGSGGSGGGSDGTSGSGGPVGQGRALVVDTAVTARAPKRARVRRRFTLTVTVYNRSASVAHAPKLTTTLPRGTQFVRARSIKGVMCKRRKRTLTCTLGSLAAGKSFTVKITVRPMRGSSWTQTARIRSNDLDPQPGNNQSRSRTRRR